MTVNEKATVSWQLLTVEKKWFHPYKGTRPRKVNSCNLHFYVWLISRNFSNKRITCALFWSFFVIWGQLARIGQLWSILLAFLVSYLHCKARICPGSFICTFLNCNWSLKIVSVVDIIPRRKCNLRTSLFCYVVKYLTDECTFSISYAHDDNTRERVRKTTSVMVVLVFISAIRFRFCEFKDLWQLLSSGCSKILVIIVAHWKEIAHPSPPDWFEDIIKCFLIE